MRNTKNGLNGPKKPKAMWKNKERGKLYQKERKSNEKGKREKKRKKKKKGEKKEKKKEEKEGIEGKNLVWGKICSEKIPWGKKWALGKPL